MAKRTFDLIVSIPLCIVATPILLVLMVILAVQHHSFSVLFVHDRIGYRGELFSVPKLRTLHRETHPYADKTETEFVVVSRLGTFLRTSHLDELPQLFLVPLGKLSLVGPRPQMPCEAEEHSEPAFVAIRTSVPAGCTGMWQVGAHTSGRVADSPEYDEFYVQQRTLRLDIWILWRTALQAFGGRGVSLDRVPHFLLRGDVAVDPTDVGSALAHPQIKVIDVPMTSDISVSSETVAQAPS